MFQPEVEQKIDQSFEELSQVAKTEGMDFVCVLMGKRQKHGNMTFHLLSVKAELTEVDALKACASAIEAELHFHELCADFSDATER